MSKKTQPTDVIEVEAEVVDASLVSKEVVAIVDKEIARLSPFEVRANELVKKYSGLTIAGVDDKDGYEEVRLAISELRSLRTSTESEKKAAKAPFKKGMDSLEQTAKKIIALIQSLELPLKTRKDQIDEEKERIKAEKKRKQDEQLIQRQQQLTALGAVYMEGMFVLEDVSFEASAIRECDEQIFEEDIKPKFQAIFDRKEEERKQKELEQEQERERLAAEQRKLAEQREELARQQRELERQQQEQRDKEQAAAQQKIKNRCIQLEGLGMKFSYSYNAYVFEDVNIDNNTEISLLPDSEWEALVERVGKAIEERKKANAEKEKQRLADYQKKLHIQSIGTARVNFLKTIGSTGYSIDELGAMDEKEWDAFFADKKQQVELQQRQMEDLKEKQRVELMKDKEKWAEIVAYLNATPMHEMKSGQYRNKMMAVRDFLETIKEL